MNKKTEEKLLSQLQRVEEEMQAKRYWSVVLECEFLFETIFKKIYRDIQDMDLEYVDYGKLYEILLKQGKGARDVRKFTFGQLVGLVIEGGIIPVWAKATNREAGLLAAVSLYPIVDLRNSIAHNGKRNVQKEEAELVYAVAKNWLTFAGYEALVDQVYESKKKEEKKEKSGNGSGFDFSHHLPPHMLPRKSSTYTYSKKSEQVRLGKAVDIYRDIDRRALDFVLENLGKKSDLTVLDVGCADGKILESRFSDRSIFSKAIGIDHNVDVIKRKQEETSDIYHYHCMDLESPNFEEELKSMMQDEGVEKFDIIFSSLVIHHLMDPNQVLRILAKQIKKGGAIILRGAEDGSKLAYDDGGLVQEIIAKSAAVQGMSDRFHGRKFYSQLHNSGFQKIYMLYEERDTVGKDFEERLEMYQLSFPYRKYYFERQLNMDPDNHQYMEDYLWIQGALKKLEEYFVRPDFYYMEIVPVAIGLKEERKK